ncbi:hypothetical protein SAMN05216345_104475 [Cupriavidus sp. YR651]|uniref:HugZ family pyridoxamine 5'-phosphate oxidase n=1 Tax=Cupriavidus sp. YR651 TaxID=1855315 RepID=UPI000888374B|nr:pyridoxamine 5'-phosphate oxidase family protein [Cupriavidus sp. YR651]SDC92325.1 hypothetical protein SAMN05216345_104475 [Cupriavidus sp. YR651]
MFVERAVNLLHEAAYGTLATHSAILPGYPYATVVPYVPDEAHRPVVCISALAEHTKNLLADSRVSLSVLQPEATDIQTARRLTVVGEAEQFEPSQAFLAHYLRYEPGAERQLALDFMFFRLNTMRVRFIEGLGRMGWLDKADLDAVGQLSGETEATLVREVSRVVPAGVSVLGIDCYGLDYVAGAFRKRFRFPTQPLLPETILNTALNAATGLS